ncbi:MAG: (d)CMP kinase [Planctomycetaceae bacterium]
MLITIDGPAGTGKSTAARRLAERLGFAYLDTGAMYRAIGLACLRAGVDPADANLSAAIARKVVLHVDGQTTRLNGLDVTIAIRSPEATAAASIVAQNSAVRALLVDLQRSVAQRGNYVCEGRDQGTVVFPFAAVKFFITATAEVRAERRRQELADRGEHVPLADLLQQQDERDRRDEERTVAPLKPAADAIRIDTSELSTEQVLEQLVHHVRLVQRKRSGAGGV